MPEAFVFDIDGTLIDSVDAHAKSWVKTFEEFGKKISLEETRKLIGMGSDQFLGDYFSKEELETNKKEIDDYRSKLFLREYLPQVKPFPKVRETLIKLKKDNVKIVLASSAKKDEVKKYKEIANIEDLIEKETSIDDVEKSKPEPDIFQAGREKLGKIEKRNIVAIGDTPYDAIAAKKAGIKCIGVLTGGWSKEKLFESGCTAIVSDVSEIFNGLRGL